MQTDKAGKLIRKIQALYENLSDQGTMSSLERDLILSYLRELYEEISLSATSGAATPRRSQELPRQESRQEPVQFKAPEPPKPVTPPPPPVERTVPPVVQEEPVPVQPEPVSTPSVREMSPPPAPPEVKQHDAASNFAPDPVRTFVETSLAPQNGHSEAEEEVLALFEFKQIGELSEKLQLLPLDRIEQGLGINERILIINELFRGDGILFNKTLKELDSMRSFEEARRYLISGVANQFKWGEKSRKSQATLFVQLVRRRFLPS